MSQFIEKLVRRIVGDSAAAGLAALDIRGQFQPGTSGTSNRASTLNAAFLLALAGSDARAEPTLADWPDDDPHKPLAEYLHDALRLVREEVERETSDNAPLREAFASAGESGAVWEALFPEGAWCLDEPAKRIEKLRHRRTVAIHQLNPEPLSDPASQLLVTSNVLLTLPHDRDAMDALRLPDDLRRALRAVADEPQAYWYDHPIPIGVPVENNEVIYGLRGLNAAVAFEKQQGHAPQDAKLTVVLSVSVTHTGLQPLAIDYLRAELAKAEPTPHLDVYVFSETATRRMIEEVLMPAAERYLAAADRVLLEPVVGVDGPYGRHYSFLKAVAAFWQVLIDSRIRATFKIDLDQVFPQAALVEQGGGSAFEHFCTPRWGATGVDSAGDPIEFGMLAGALVNESDIARGLFTPDVTMPQTIPTGEASVFYPRLPMALSTQAEMMCRYDTPSLDGRTTCLQRIHVTGGTNGILIDALRRHRPFTPTFIGRAEDQGYLLSVLWAGDGPHLRYVHEPGLIMRHDKEAFAGDAIKAARGGRFIGDLMRTLYFSHYVRALPWRWLPTKRMIDPFTGAFTSRVPITLVHLRLALAVAERFANDKSTAHDEAHEMLRLAAEQVGPLARSLVGQTHPLAEQFVNEQRGWAIYYDTLDHLEQALRADNTAATDLASAARRLVESCHITPGSAR